MSVLKRSATLDNAKCMEEENVIYFLGFIHGRSKKTTVFFPGFQNGRVPSEKGTLAQWTDRQKGTLARWTDRQKGTLARWTEDKGHN